MLIQKGLESGNSLSLELTQIIPAVEDFSIEGFLLGYSLYVPIY
jgi:hypothetical protein